VYLVNKTITQNYGYIDPNAPEKGIKISFPPYHTWENMTDTNNISYVF